MTMRKMTPQQQKNLARVNTAVSAGMSVQQYRSLRKNHYGREGAFATAATYAAVGELNGQVVSRLAPKKLIYAIPIGIATNMAADELISRRVEKHFNPATYKPKKRFYKRKVRGKTQTVRVGRRQ